jgi:hypothetical protein
VAEAVSVARSVRPRVAVILGGRLASDPTVIGDLDIDAAEVSLGAATRFADERMASLSSRA